MKNNLRKNSSRALKLSLLAGAGTAGFAADNVRADIVSTNLNGVSDGGSSIGFSFTNGLIGTSSSEGNMTGKWANPAFAGGNYFGYTNNNLAQITVLPVSLGSLIDGNSSWVPRVENITTGVFDLYYGIRFNQGNGDYNYSWLQMATTNNSLTFGNAGVETTVNAAIAAGDTGAVPEPSTYALLALAGGAAALAALRRKKAA